MFASKDDLKKVRITCPTCSKKQFLNVAVDVQLPENGIATFSVNAACGHTFQVFIDKHLKVRGSQKADVVLSSELIEVDEQLSEFARIEGIGKAYQAANANKPSNIKNVFDDERVLAIVIQYFKSANISDTYAPRVLMPAGPPVPRAMPQPLPGIKQEKVLKGPVELGKPPVVQVPVTAFAPAIPVATVKATFVEDGSIDTELWEMEDIKIQYHDRIRRINELLMDIEISTFEEGVSTDGAKNMKRLRLQRIKEQLETQYEKLSKAAS
jgi:hypothetical protein